MPPHHPYSTLLLPSWKTSLGSKVLHCRVKKNFDSVGSVKGKGIVSLLTCHHSESKKRHYVSHTLSWKGQKVNGEEKRNAPLSLSLLLYLLSLLLLSFSLSRAYILSHTNTLCRTSSHHQNTGERNLLCAEKNINTKENCVKLSLFNFLFLLLFVTFHSLFHSN